MTNRVARAIFNAMACVYKHHRRRRKVCEMHFSIKNIKVSKKNTYDLLQYHSNGYTLLTVVCQSRVEIMNIVV